MATLNIDPQVEQAFALIKQDDPADEQNYTRRLELQDLLTKINPNAVDARGWPLLHVAINKIASQFNRRGKGKIDRDSPLGQLLAHPKINVNQLYVSKNHFYSPLNIAVMKNLPDVVDALIAKGALCDNKVKLVLPRQQAVR